VEIGLICNWRMYVAAAITAAPSRLLGDDTANNVVMLNTTAVSAAAARPVIKRCLEYILVLALHLLRITLQLNIKSYK
jgi:hypothetical protein